MIPDVLILSAVPTPTPVSAEPSSAGSVPVIFAAGTFVKFAALIAGSVPVMFAAGILVKFAALIAGKFPVKLPAGRLVKFAPLIAGRVPVIFAAGMLVRFAALIAGNAPDNFEAVSVEILASATVPVIFAAGILVRFAALIAGKFPVRLPAGRLVKFAPLPECPPTNVVAVIIPVVTLLTTKSPVVPSARKIEISPPFPVILFIPDILLGRITVISLFIIPLQNYHQHSEPR